MEKFSGITYQKTSRGYERRFKKEGLKAKAICAIDSMFTRIRSSAPERKKEKLMRAVLALSVFAAGVGAWKTVEEVLKELEGNDMTKIETSIEDTPPETEKILNETDALSIRQIIPFGEPVELNPEKMKSLEKFYYNKYMDKKSGLGLSLASAHKGITAWLPYLQQEFGKQAVPDFSLLAIPESHWEPATSSAGAGGYYQIMPPNAERFYMEISKMVDDRNDPIFSARVCAKMLKELLVASHGDEDLALSGYNGGFIWKYLEGRGESVSYLGFLEYLEDKIEHIRVKIDNSKKYKTREAKEAAFYDKISGYAENLCYPAKYYAAEKAYEDRHAELESSPVVKYQEKYVKPDYSGSGRHKKAKKVTFVKFCQANDILVSEAIGLNPQFHSIQADVTNRVVRLPYPQAYESDQDASSAVSIASRY